MDPIPIVVSDDAKGIVDNDKGRNAADYVVVCVVYKQTARRRRRRRRRE